MNLRTILTDAKKALGALAVMESAAVGFGVLDSVTAGYVTAGLGIATAGVVYLLGGPGSKTASLADVTAALHGFAASNEAGAAAAKALRNAAADIKQPDGPGSPGHSTD